MKTKFRIISGAACFYATAKEIREGLGDFGNFNLAVLNALEALEFVRKTEEPGVAEVESFDGVFNEIHVDLRVVE